MASAPPGSLAYQFAHRYESRQASVVTINLTLISLSTFATILRLLARRLVKVRLGYDDLCIIFAQLVAIAYCTLTIVATHHGFAIHEVAVDVRDALFTRKLQYIIELLYTVSLFAVKYSILIFYYNIFSIQRFRRAIWIYAGFLVSYTIATTLPAIFICVPINRYWDESLSGHCINHQSFAFIASIITLTMDLIVLLMPLPVIWSLKVTTQQKLALSCIFLVGILACVVSVLRLTSIPYLYTDDRSWDSYWPSIWSTIELNVCLICASLPVLRPIARRIADLRVVSYLTSGTRPGRSTVRSAPNTASSSTKVSVPKRKKAFYGSMDDTLFSNHHVADIEAPDIESKAFAGDVKMADLASAGHEMAESNPAPGSDEISVARLNGISVSHHIEVREEREEASFARHKSAAEKSISSIFGRSAR